MKTVRCCHVTNVQQGGWGDSLEVLVFSGAADLGGVALGQFVQASGVLQLELRFTAKELLQVLQQLEAGVGLLLQTTELLHQLVTDLCITNRESTFRTHRDPRGVGGGEWADTLGLTSAPTNRVLISFQTSACELRLRLRNFYDKLLTTKSDRGDAGSHSGSGGGRSLNAVSHVHMR